MQYLITLDPRTDIIEDLVRSAGPESYLYLCQLLQRFLEIGSYRIDAETVRKECAISNKKAEKIAPFLCDALLKTVEGLEKVSQVFSKHLEKKQESFEKFYARNAKVFESFAKAQASNPRGSTRVKAKLSEAKQREANKICATDVAPPSSANEFDQWYASYPRHRDKKRAALAYQKARESATAEQLLAGVETYKRIKPPYADWKHPATWLNAGGWLDEPDKPQEARPVANISEQRAKSLSAFPAIRHMGTGEVFLKADLVYTLNEIIYNGNVLDLAVYEGFTPNANLNPA